LFKLVDSTSIGNDMFSGTLGAQPDITPSPPKSSRQKKKRLIF